VEGKLYQKYIYESEKGKEYSSVQANKVEINKDSKLIMGGCEDGFIRFFDYSSTKLIKKLQTNTSITSLLAWDWEVAAGDHQGSLHIWDSRMFKQL
jgi:WD40 repeat protein